MVVGDVRTVPPSEYLGVPVEQVVDKISRYGAFELEFCFICWKTWTQYRQCRTRTTSHKAVNARATNVRGKRRPGRGPCCTGWRTHPGGRPASRRSSSAGRRTASPRGAHAPQA